MVNGGIINAYGANAKVGEGDWIVVEADESDGTFLRLRSTVAVVTNIDPEHLDHYGDFDAVKRAFQSFVESMPFYGFAAICIDDPGGAGHGRPGREPPADHLRHQSPGRGARHEHRRSAPEGSTFDVLISAADGGATTCWASSRLPMAGQHNVLNALAAIAMAASSARRRRRSARAWPASAACAGASPSPARRTACGWSTTTATTRWRSPPCCKRRARGDQRPGDRGGPAAPLHRGCSDLFQEFCRCFNDADVVIVADVYPAGEAPIEGASREALVEGLRRYGHRHVLPLAGPDGLAGPDRRRGQGRATSSSASAPATSPPGPRPCRPSSRRWGRRR